ncbi:membrane protein insertion efficiency factor YidD [Deinococcus pimensis]|uniref:membrane protein insertion efficiency factor YidD n=1 Tax=Deinococcus pimensis TaxID=309888 RepID=UPI00048181D5|nr:membrane protein insertion efficiency factor YidD [Deinococcus pimensis]
MTSPATRLALVGIDGYRRHLSPLKGFRCAHAALFGGASCSQAVRDIVERDGLLAGRAAVVARLDRCRSAYAHLRGAPGVQVQGLCCCGPLPIPFRCG